MKPRRNDEDYAEERQRLISGLAGSQPAAPEVLAAMGRVPRETFVERRLSGTAMLRHALANETSQSSARRNIADVRQGVSVSHSRPQRVSADSDSTGKVALGGETPIDDISGLRIKRLSTRSRLNG